METDPINFVVPGSEVQVKFHNNDEVQYFSGTIKQVNHYGRDANGGYVNCYIIYDDGEEIPDAVLYNGDFENKDSEDTWKFNNNLSLIIKGLYDNTKDIIDLKERVEMFEGGDYTLSSESDEDYESDEDEPEESEDGSECCAATVVKKDGWFVATSKFVLNMSMSMLFMAYSFKLARDSQLV